MSWEALPERIRRARTSWGLSAGKSGITIWFPKGHALGASKAVVTQLGKKEHEGWIRLVPSQTGRMVNRVNKDGGCFVKYSTLPGAPGAMTMTELTVREEPNGAVMVKLPWEQKPAAFSMR